MHVFGTWFTAVVNKEDWRSLTAVVGAIYMYSCKGLLGKEGECRYIVKGGLELFNTSSQPPSVYI